MNPITSNKLHYDRLRCNINNKYYKFDKIETKYHEYNLYVDVVQVMTSWLPI